MNLSISEQLAIVAQQAQSEFHRVLMYVCIAFLCATLIAVLVKCFADVVWDKIRSLWSLSKIQFFLVSVFTIGLIQYGATKAYVPKIDFDQNLINNGSSVTNNLVDIRWGKKLGSAIPDSAAVYIDYRIYNSTNEWDLLAETTVGQYHWSGIVQNATNFEYSVWVYYIPPEPVHTNGVWAYKTMHDRHSKFAIPIRARIEVNGKAIATPKEKRKDEEDD